MTEGVSYAIDLQLNQGSSSSAVSTVDATNFNFGGGSAIEPGPGASPGVTGDLNSGVQLSTGTTAYPEFTQNYNNGSYMSFVVNASGLSKPTASNAPDQFVFDIYNNTTAAPVTTLGSNDGFDLFTLTKGTDGSFITQTYGYEGVGNTSFSAPTVTPAATPELSTFVGMGIMLSLFGLGVLTRAYRERRDFRNKIGRR